MYLYIYFEVGTTTRERCTWERLWMYHRGRSSTAILTPWFPKVTLTEVLLIHVALNLTVGGWVNSPTHVQSSSSDMTFFLLLPPMRSLLDTHEITRGRKLTVGIALFCSGRPRGFCHIQDISIITLIWAGTDDFKFVRHCGFSVRTTAHIARWPFGEIPYSSH